MSSTVTPLTLNGISQYASDFQSILTRSVQTASIPLQALQNQQSTITQEQADISGLSSAVANVATDLGTLGNLGSTRALTANSSDPSVVEASATGATANTTYTISNVTSVAHAASESSINSYGDGTTTPVSATGSLQLTVGSTNYPITLAIEETDVRGLLRSDASNEEIVAVIRGNVAAKWVGHEINSPQFVAPPRPMYSIGG